MIGLNYEVFRDSPVRIVITENNEPLFCGSDVAKLLGFKAPSVAVAQKCKSKNLLTYYDKYRPQKLVFIPKGDVVNLAKTKINDTETFIDDLICGEITERLPSENPRFTINLDKIEKEKIFKVSLNQEKFEITVKKLS